MASFDVYDAAGTSLGTVATSSATWTHQQGEDGSGSITTKGDTAAALLAETTIVRVNDGTRDVFAFVPTSKTRRQVERSTELDLSGPGVKWLLHAGQVLQEDTTDCAEAASARWVGWMSSDYDDTAWGAPVSFGTFVSGPWETTRPEGWPDPTAEYIGTDEGAFAFGATPPGDVYFRKTFTTVDEQDVVLVIAADDEYRVWLDGTEMLSTIGGGPFQWKRAQQRPVRLCAGTHTIAVMVHNLERPAANFNYGWLLASLYPADGDGRPTSASQLYKVYHDHSAGTFTLTVSSETTVPIDFDAAAGDVELALENLSTVGAGNVTVSGSGRIGNQRYHIYHDHSAGEFTLDIGGFTTLALAHNISAANLQAALEGLTSVGAGNVVVSGAGTVGSPWDVEFVNDLALTSVSITLGGSTLTGGTGFEIDSKFTGANSPWEVEFSGSKANIWVLMTGSGAGLSGGTGFEVDEAQRGSYAASIVHTDTTWKIDAYPVDALGLTPGAVLRILMEEAQARGTTVLDNFSFGFSDTVDSDGAAWADNLTFPISLPADIHRVAVMLEEMGYGCDVTPDLTLECWGDRGSDLSAAVTLSAGTANVTNINATQDETAVSNVIRYRSGEGWGELTSITSIADRGRWESGINLEAFSTELDALRVVAPLRADIAIPPRSTTLEIPSEAALIPYTDFDLCDIISAPAFGTAGFEATDMRVVSIGGRIEERSIVWSLELID